MASLSSWRLSRLTDSKRFPSPPLASGSSSPPSPWFLLPLPLPPRGDEYPTSSRAHRGSDNGLPKSGPFPPFFLVFSHRLWSQTRPASASASCREPSSPWWWSWPSGDLSPRLWGRLARDVGLSTGPVLGEEEGGAWEMKWLRSRGRKGGCLVLSPPLGTGETRVQASLGSPAPGTKNHRPRPGERAPGGGSSSNSGPFLWLPAWCPCLHCMC